MGLAWRCTAGCEERLSERARDRERDTRGEVREHRRKDLGFGRDFILIKNNMFKKHKNK